MWQCPECNETVEPSLHICWKCGTSRDGTRDPDFKSVDNLARPDTANLSQVDPTLLTSAGPTAPPALPNIKFVLRTFLGIAAVCAILFAIGAWYNRAQTPEDFYRLGMAHLESEEYPEGIADLTRAVEIIEDEDDQSILPVLYAARALAFNNQGNYASALHDTSRAIDLLTPRRVFGLMAMDSSQDSFFVSPEILTSLHLVRGNALIGLGRKAEAIRDLNVVLQEDPKNQVALHLLAVAEGRKDVKK